MQNFRSSSRYKAWQIYCNGKGPLCKPNEAARLQQPGLQPGLAPEGNGLLQMPMTPLGRAKTRITTRAPMVTAR